MSEIPEDLLTLDLVKSDGSLGEYKEMIDKHQVTSLHVIVGLIPKGLGMKTFDAIRRLYLSSIDRQQLFDEFPSFMVLSSNSASDEIKAYLKWAGIRMDKINSLPELTFEMFVHGRLGPILNSSDISLIRTKCNNLIQKSSRIYDLLKYRSGGKLETLTGSKDSLGDLFCMNPFYIHPMEPISTHLDMNVFKTPYMNHEEIIAKGLLKDVQARFANHTSRDNNFNRQKVYAPWVRLTNAPGTGKTRAIFELGNLCNVLYINLKDGEAIKRSVVGEVIVEFLEDKTVRRDLLTTSCMLFFIFQKLIHMCKILDGIMTLKGCMCADVIVEKYVQYVSKHPQARCLRFLSFKHQVEAVLLENIQICSSWVNKCAQSFEKDTFLPTNVDELFWEYGISSISNDDTVELLPTDKSWTIFTANDDWLCQRARLLNPAFGESAVGVDVKNIEKSLPKLIIVFDDVEHIISNCRPNAVVIYQDRYLESMETYRVIKEVIRYYEFHWRCLFITVSSYAETDHFEYPKWHPSWRRPRVQGIMHGPIILKSTIDALCEHGAYKEDSESNWMNFLFSDRRVGHIASLGRPLWGKLLLDKVYENLLMQSRQSKFCKYHALIPGDVLMSFETMLTSFNNQDFELMTILGLAVGLNKCPPNMSESKLIQVGSMVLNEFLKAQESYAYMPHGIFKSEGILNGWAAFKMIFCIDKVMDWALKLVKKDDSSFLSVEEFGEMMGRVSVLIAMNARRIRTLERLWTRSIVYETNDVSEYVFAPIGIEDFLETCAGRDATEAYLGAALELKGSFVAFSHFMYADVEKDLYRSLADGLTRGAAVIPQKTIKGVDFLIPLVLSNGQLSFICWQTKFGAKFENHLDTESVQKDSPFEVFKNSLHFDRPNAHIIRIINGNRELKCKIYQKPPASMRHDNIDSRVELGYYNVGGEETGRKRQNQDAVPDPCLSIIGFIKDDGWQWRVQPLILGII